MLKYLLVGVVGLLVILAIVFRGNLPFMSTVTEMMPTNLQVTTKKDANGSFSFSNPKKSAHYETNTPSHESVLAAVPVNVVIDFNFDLAAPSEIKIIKDGKDFHEGPTTIDPNKLSMRRSMVQDSPDGLYTVEYTACWPDGSCHEGMFQFAIDRSKTTDYIDQTNKKEITVNLKDIQFTPQNIKVSKGTKVVWVNNDQVEHYVNTDSHPAHTYHLEQNSKSLKSGESYSVVFDKEGIYPYHCSAHASSMVGSIIVE